MPQGKERHMFPGGNTCKGFFSYYQYVMPQDQAERIFILKGGPGVGKSTFMKQIASAMLERGIDVEYMHCSSDPDSLDGVVFPKMRIALIDGTAPHIVDPKNPGVVDEIVNLGAFWVEEGILRNKSEILRLNREIGKIFARAYRYIRAAYGIYQDNEDICSRAMDAGKANSVIAQVVDQIFQGIDVSEIVGKQRHLFASAITPKGLVHFLPSLITTKGVIVLKGKPGTGTERLIERIRLAATERGIDTESYYCALNPQKLEHLIIPELDISITTENAVHQIGKKTGMEIDLDAYLNESILSHNRDVIQFNNEEFDKLLKRAVQTIKQAKSYHDDLESYYIPNMKFDGVQKCRDAILARLLQ